MYGSGRVFYGWWVVVGGILVRLATAPGHSFGISAFVDAAFVNDLQLTRTQMSLIWLAASCSSACLTPVAGAAIDHFGARCVCLTVAPILFLCLLGLSRVQGILSLMVGLSTLRFVGPECLSLAAGTSCQRWFVRLRGRASALLATNGILLMAMPTLMTSLIEALGWRGAFQVLSVVLTLLLLLGTALVRDSPEACGLSPDGVDGGPRPLNDNDPPPGVAKQAAASLRPPLESSTLREAMRHPLFWCFNALEVIFSLFWSGFNFYFLSFVGSSDSPQLSALTAPRVASDVFLPLSVCQNGLKIGVSLLLVDKMSPAARATVYAALSVVVAGACASCLALRTEAQLFAWAAAYGISTGVLMALSEVLNASLFGTHALGRLLGMTRGLTTAATGLGPVIFAASYDLHKSYKPAVIGAAASHAAVAVATIVVARSSLPDAKRRPLPRVGSLEEMLPVPPRSPILPTSYDRSTEGGAV